MMRGIRGGQVVGAGAIALLLTLAGCGGSDGPDAAIDPTEGTDPITAVCDSRLVASVDRSSPRPRQQVHLRVDDLSMCGGTPTFTWEQTAGVPVTLTHTNLPIASFEVPAGLAATTLTFRLTAATDQQSVFSEVSVTTQADSGSCVPAVTAAAGDATPREFDEVNLYLAEQERCGTTASYQWTQIAGPAATVTNAGAENAAIVVPSVAAATELRFRVTMEVGGTPYTSDVVLNAQPSERDGYTQFYDIPPDVASCNEGVLKTTEKQRYLDQLNQIRAIHRLDAVGYEAADDVLTAKSALITAANEAGSHSPPEEWLCWSSEGALGSATSNLSLWLHTAISADFDQSLKSLVRDGWVESLGHRRWLLDPFLAHISYGRVDKIGSWNGYPASYSAASIKVVNDVVKPSAGSALDYVGYPYGDYPFAYAPATEYLSLSAIADRTSRWNNEAVDYTAATVTMLDPNGVAVVTESLGYSNEGYGLPNVIKWKMASRNVNEIYTVVISGVRIGETVRNFAYWFRVLP